MYETLMYKKCSSIKMIECKLLLVHCAQTGPEFREHLNSDHDDPRQVRTHLHVRRDQVSNLRACAVPNSKCEMRMHPRLQFMGNLLQDIVECSCQDPCGSHPGSEGT